MELETNSIFVSRDLIFYENIFPFASISPSSKFSDPTSLDTSSDSFVFPYSLPDSSISDSSFLNDSSISFPDSVNTVSVDQIHGSPLRSQSPHVTPAVDSKHDLVPISVPRPNSPLPLRISTRPYNLPSYLQDYSCKFVTSKPVTSKPSSSMLYDIFACLTYSNLSKNISNFSWQLIPPHQILLPFMRLPNLLIGKLLWIRKLQL